MKTFDLSSFPPADTLRLVAQHIDALCAAAPMGMNGMAMLPSGNASPITTHAQALLHHQQLQQLQAQSRAAAQGTTASPVSTAPHPAHCSPFHASAIPSIDLETYLSRVLKYCPCASECFLALVVYMERACDSGMVQLDRFSAHRLCIIGVVVASKFFSDVFFTNSRYAKVGGLPVGELNQLEIIFLKYCDFKLAVSLTELQATGDRLLRYRRVQTAPPPPPITLPMAMVASEPPTPTSPYDIATMAWRQCPESPMTSGSSMSQQSPYPRTPTEYFPQHVGPMQARPRHLRTFSYHPHMNQSYASGLGLHHPHTAAAAAGFHGSHAPTHTLAHANSFGHAPVMSHLQQQQQQQTASPDQHMSRDSGYFAMTPDQVTTPTGHASMLMHQQQQHYQMHANQANVPTTAATTKSGAPISHRHSYAHPVSQAYPLHHAFAAEHVASRLQQQQQQHQQLHQQQQQQQQFNLHFPPMSQRQRQQQQQQQAALASKMHMTNVLLSFPPVSAVQGAPASAPASRKHTPAPAQLAMTQSASSAVASSSSALNQTFFANQQSIAGAAAAATASVPMSTSPASTGSISRFVVESPTACCAPIAAENNSDRPGPLGDRAGVSPLNSSLAGRESTCGASSPIDSSMQGLHRRSSSISSGSSGSGSSSSRMSLHGRSPLATSCNVSGSDDVADETVLATTPSMLRPPSFSSVGRSANAWRTSGQEHAAVVSAAVASATAMPFIGGAGNNMFPTSAVSNAVATAGARAASPAVSKMPNTNSAPDNIMPQKRTSSEATGWPTAASAFNGGYCR